MNFPGMPGRGLAGGGETAGMNAQEQAVVKNVWKHGKSKNFTAGRSRIDDPQMQAAMESCPAKTVISGGMGFALGGAFGLFMSSVRLSRARREGATELTRRSDGADELRYASDRARAATR